MVAVVMCLLVVIWVYKHVARRSEDVVVIEPGFVPRRDSSVVHTLGSMPKPAYLEPEILYPIQDDDVVPGTYAVEPTGKYEGYAEVDPDEDVQSEMCPVPCAEDVSELQAMYDLATMEGLEFGFDAGPMYATARPATKEAMYDLADGSSEGAADNLYESAVDDKGMTASKNMANECDDSVVYSSVMAEPDQSAAIYSKVLISRADSDKPFADVVYSDVCAI